LRSTPAKNLIVSLIKFIVNTIYDDHAKTILDK